MAKRFYTLNAQLVEGILGTSYDRFSTQCAFAESWGFGVDDEAFWRAQFTNSLLAALLSIVYELARKLMTLVGSLLT